MNTYGNPQRIFRITEYRIPPRTSDSRGWGRWAEECFAWCHFFAEDYAWNDDNKQAQLWFDMKEKYRQQVEWKEATGIAGHVSDPTIERELDKRGLVEEKQICYKHQYK